MEIDDLVVKANHVEFYQRLDDEFTVRFRADDIRKERTGIHAKILLGVNHLLMAYDNFNLERDGERTRLANSAYKSYPEAACQLYSLKQLKHDLDIFSTLVWNKWVGANVPSRVVGYIDRSLPDFVLSPYIVNGGGTMLFGPPERMKTMTALTWAICIDAGLTWPFSVKQGPILYINLERPDGSMQRRLGDLNRSLGLDPDRPLLMMNARGKSLHEVEEAVSRSVKEEGVTVGFLDSISRAGYGDLIDNRVANQTIDIMNGLFPSWVGIAHSPRNDASHMFGSMHFEAGADIIVQLLTEYQDNRIGVGMQVVKANDMQRPPLGSLGYEFDDYGVTRIWTPDIQDFPELLAITAQRGGLTDEVKLFLKGNGEANADDISKAIMRSRGAVAKLLAASDQFSIVRREGHKVFYDIVDSPVQG
jgi:hypothetical protein